MRVKKESSYPNELFENGRGPFVGLKTGEEQLVALEKEEQLVLQYHPGARKEGVSGSLSGRRSEEVNQSNTSSPWGVRSTF